MKCFSRISWVILSLLLIGCAPMYKTQYSYNPPKSTTGMMCINNCESNINNCRQMEDMKKSNCEYRTDLDYRMCMDHKKSDKDSCYRSSCYTDYEHCTGDYNRCYQGCGGIVNSQQVCVAFCK
jgi:hypothetical protein